MASFIKKNDFDFRSKQREEKEKVLSWTELSQETIYRITEVEIIEDGPYGTTYLVCMVDIDDNTVTVWGSNKLVRDLKGKEQNKIPYIRSQGQKKYGKGKTINVYSLAFDKGEEIISLFKSSSSFPLSSFPSSPSPPKKKN